MPSRFFSSATALVLAFPLTTFAAEELHGTVWADESLLGSPVAISLDRHGRAYVTVTARRKDSELDIRSHREWIPQVLAMESRDDLRAFLTKELSPERSSVNQPWLRDRNDDGLSDLSDLGVISETIVRLEDVSGKGIADTGMDFVRGLNESLTGVAAGVLCDGDDVFVSAIPQLWQFSSSRTPGPARAKPEALLDGFGVRIAYSGHDMHGLTAGPDGRIYWSIGDKGLNVKTPDGRTVRNTHSGSILRCDPDGSGLELYATGLRNPQEIAFDEYGNLFAADNDGDFPGERERFVFVAEGSDSGWRSHWQYRQDAWNPWMDEHLAEPVRDGQAAYFLPPLAHIGDGPCGFVYQPGTALGASFGRTFFLTHFPGRKLVAFTVDPDGAGFKMNQPRTVFTGPMLTGLAWGPDGALYAADWNSSAWEPHKKGKVWRLDVAAAAANSERAAVQQWLREGLEWRHGSVLARLLGHPDRRIRLDAQRELARREDRTTLREAFRTGEPGSLTRVHAVRGLGQIARHDADASELLLGFLTNPETTPAPGDLAQLACAAGDCDRPEFAPPLTALLNDPQQPAPVRLQAAIALGKLHASGALPAVLSLLRTNAGRDKLLRHAGIMALAGIAIPDLPAFVTEVLRDTPEVRLAAVVALRRRSEAAVASFLADPDPAVATEAALAIHDDASIPAALPALAASLTTFAPDNAPAVRRALSANLRIGGPEAAGRLAAFAANGAAPVRLRTEALDCLTVWTAPGTIDRVEGRHRPWPAHPAADLQAPLETLLSVLRDDPGADLSAALCRLTAAAGSARASDWLASLVAAESRSLTVRLEALRSLATLKSPQFPAVLRTALESKKPDLRSAALNMLSGNEHPDAGLAPRLAAILADGAIPEQQLALTILGRIRTPEAVSALTAAFGKLTAGTLPAGLHLDLLTAAESSGNPDLTALAASYKKDRPAGDPVSQLRETLTGGNAARGKAVALTNLAVQCTRCHKIGSTGADVGPDLAKTGTRLTRDLILESLVLPNAKIAPGYGIVTLTLTGGRSVSGTFVSEDAGSITICPPGDINLLTPKKLVLERSAPASVMPPVGLMVTPHELRDLIEFLATLQ